MKDRITLDCVNYIGDVAKRLERVAERLSQMTTAQLINLLSQEAK